MPHIEVERDTVREHIVDAFCDRLGIDGVVFLAPVIEPARVILADHSRNAGAEFCERLELFRRVLPPAKVDDRKHVRQCAALQHRIARPVRGEERNGKSRIDQTLFYCIQIFLVAAERAVFVLDLRHYDVAAVLNLERSEAFSHLFHIPVGGGKKRRVVRTDLHIPITKQPCRKAAEVPLRANIRAGANDQPKAFFLSEFCKVCDILAARKIEFAGLRLVLIPEDVCRDRV